MKVNIDLTLEYLGYVSTVLYYFACEPNPMKASGVTKEEMNQAIEKMNELKALLNKYRSKYGPTYTSPNHQEKVIHD